MLSVRLQRLTNIVKCNNEQQRTCSDCTRAQTERDLHTSYMPRRRLFPWWSSNEPKHEKTYLLTYDSNPPAYPRSLIRVFVVHTKKLCILGYPKCAQWRFWSDCANAQADLNLRLGGHVRRYVFPRCVANYKIWTFSRNTFAQAHYVLL